VVGLLGWYLSGSQWWYLAVPGALAAGWLGVANPERCLPQQGHNSRGGKSAACQATSRTDPRRCGRFLGLPEGVVHYRWPGWLTRIADARLVRSMSRKACPPDNAACEGFFGRLKYELFYARNWLATTIDEFIAELDAYVRWYNAARIKDVARLTQPAGAPQGSGDRCLTSPSFLPHPQGVSFSCRLTRPRLRTSRHARQCQSR
jgi:Integrase core domain